MTQSIAAALAIAAVPAALASCRSRNSASHGPADVASATASASGMPLDHLLPGELSASSALVFGFPVPSGMTIERLFPDAAHLVGDVAVPGVVDYVQKHAVVSPPELAGSTLVFDPARIPSQGEGRRYRIELNSIGRRVRLLIRDTTPPPPQPDLTDDERWRQAGLRPNGEPLNPTELQ